MAQMYEEEWAFYEQLRHYYLDHKSAIRSRYKRMTLKLLDYNDRSVRPEATTASSLRSRPISDGDFRVR